MTALHLLHIHWCAGGAFLSLPVEDTGNCLDALVSLLYLGSVLRDFSVLLVFSLAKSLRRTLLLERFLEVLPDLA